MTGSSCLSHTGETKADTLKIRVSAFLIREFYTMFLWRNLWRMWKSPVEKMFVPFRPVRKIIGLRC